MNRTCIRVVIAVFDFLNGNENEENLKLVTLIFRFRVYTSVLETISYP